jgi:hypothetical protein
VDLEQSFQLQAIKIRTIKKENERMYTGRYVNETTATNNLLVKSAATTARNFKSFDMRRKNPHASDLNTQHCEYMTRQTASFL